MKKHILHISGTHCASCKILIESILHDDQNLQNAEVSLRSKTLTVDSSVDDTESIVGTINALLQSHGYRVSTEQQSLDHNRHNMLPLALLIGVAFLVGFFVLQKSGILNIGIGGPMTAFTSFAIGLVASVSSCLAVVGGLVLSLSARVSQDNISDRKTFILFHAGRIVSFALLGGVLGMLGQAIGISTTVTALLGLLASSIMILLGLHLVGVLRRNHAVLPSGIFKYFRTIEHTTWAPILVGVGTFFLPCGFTQSMQVAALSSGSFMSGFSIMLAFVLGTFPMLALLSFGSSSIAHSRYAPLFFKSAGVIVVGLGLFAFVSGLVGLGIINPIFTL